MTRRPRDPSGDPYLGYAYPSQARDLDVFPGLLRDLGYVERKNLVIESRSAESSFERLPARRDFRPTPLPVELRVVPLPGQERLP